MQFLALLIIVSGFQFIRGLIFQAGTLVKSTPQPLLLFDAVFLCVGYEMSPFSISKHLKTYIASPSNVLSRQTRDCGKQLPHKSKPV